MSQLICHNLTIGYDKHIICQDLNFEINKGDYVAIVGENGSGKSTLIKTLVGLINPISGSIEFGDGLSNNQIGYLPQQTFVQKDFPASVYEIVLSGFVSKLKLRPFYSKKEKEIAKNNIHLLDLTDLMNKSFRDLSGGQQQRVLIARSLCATSEILILDEPVNGLDPIVTADLYQLIKELNSYGITIVMISHDINNALLYANKIIHIDKNPFSGTIDEYLKSAIGKKFLAKEGNQDA